MKSGLEGRNNVENQTESRLTVTVSMKSGLEGRNNHSLECLGSGAKLVSMKSGLEGRNNRAHCHATPSASDGLNEVRPRRPEQWIRAIRRIGTG